MKEGFSKEQADVVAAALLQNEKRFNNSIVGKLASIVGDDGSSEGRSYSMGRTVNFERTKSQFGFNVTRLRLW